ncbi:DUF350 domain-containing protein [Desulfococcaceae bacterium HSG7]|nr:DUF350 domain-containing protein [Desulfococcaceae bacterium HSG7]
MQLNQLFTSFGLGAIYAVITLMFIIIAKQIADKRTVDIDDDYEIREKSNAAVGFRRTGLYLAYAIAFAGTLAGDSAGFVSDLIALLLDGVVITFCLFCCRTLNDRVMLAYIDNDKAAGQGNTAVGLAECGMYIATGFVLNGSFTGASDNIIIGLISAIVFFVLGQAALLLCGYCYEIISPFNVQAEIKKGNVAAGVALAGVLIALGIILRASIAGPSVGWGADILSFFLYTLYGIALLLLFRKAIEWFLLPGACFATEVARDKNVAAVVLTQAAMIAIAVIISAVM